MKVVLPDALGPIKEMVSPLLQEMEILLSTVSFPNFLDILFVTIIV